MTFSCPNQYSRELRLGQSIGYPGETQFQVPALPPTSYLALIMSPGVHVASLSGKQGESLSLEAPFVPTSHAKGAPALMPARRGLSLGLCSPAAACQEEDACAAARLRGLQPFYLHMLLPHAVVMTIEYLCL